MTDLFDALTLAVARLPGPFRAAHDRLFIPEHLRRLADRLDQFQRHGVPSEPPPRFAVELPLPLAEAFAPFRTARMPEALAEAIRTAGCPGLLLLLGQRLTPASVTDARAIPLPRAELLAAAAAPNPQGLSAASRALAKHAGRSAEPFWELPRGPVITRNEMALAVVARILDGATWWNVFGHPQHQLVYEARLPSGHGARWRQEGDGSFVGFLEPFLEDGAPG